MSEVDSGEAGPELPGIGSRLRLAREAAGLGSADIASRTRIAERHILSIEAGRFGDLASSTYAIGFARAYARVLGLDEREVAEEVRAALGQGEASPSRGVAVFEPGDPARVPGAPIAWMAALAALVAVALVWVLWPSYYSPAGTLPDLTVPMPAPATNKGTAPRTVANPAPPHAPVGGEVVFTATRPDVWVKFYDGEGIQLMQKIMAQGESFAVPAGVIEPRIWTARPDALAITVGGRQVPPLAERQIMVKDVSVTAAALLARPAPSPSASAASPAPSPAAPRSPTSTVSD